MTPFFEHAAWKWLRRDWHFLLLAAAAVVLACGYFPSYCLKGLESDMVIPAIFSWDLLQGGHATDWYWGGASFLFPDLSAHFILRLVLGDGVRALEAASALLFAGWLIAVVTGYRSSGLPHVEVFAAMMLLAGLGIAQFSLPSFFHSVEHGGAYLVTLLAAGWLLRAWRLGKAGLFSVAIWAAVLLLTSASDSLFLVVFVGPAVATLLCGAYHFPERRSLGIYLSLVVGFAGIAGILISRAVFPPHVYTADYLQISFGRIHDALRTLRPILDPRTSGAIAFLAWGDGIAIVVLGVCLAREWRIPAGAKSPVRFFILAFSFFLLTITWAGSIVSGNFSGLYTTRYVVLALVWPVLLLAGWLSARWSWPRGLVQTAAVLAVGICVAFALHPPVPAGYLYETQVMQPGLADLMKQENSPVALGGYWRANITTVTSNGAVRVLPLSEHGQAFHWFVNRTWFERPPAGGFRLVLTRYEDPELFRADFGEPARVVRIGDDDVWVYGPEDAIRYIPTFDTVGNRHSFPDNNTYRVHGAGIFHSIGHLEGDAVVAEAGHDRNGFLTDSPEFTVGPGRYRMEFTYAFRAAPQPGLEPVFTVCLEQSGKPLILYSGKLPYDGPGPRKVADVFTIPPGQQGLLHGEIEFRGSGTIEVDQQEVQRLGD